MGVYSGNDVDTAGDAEVTLKTAAGVELLGQQTSAASLPIVIASNQSTLNTVHPILTTGFSTSAVKTTIGTTELNFLFLKNPNASGKTLVLRKLDFGNIHTVDGSWVRVRVYSNPTSSADGSANTRSTLSVGSGNSATVTAFTTPTTSANGALLLDLVVYSGQSCVYDFQNRWSVAANNTVLTTVIADSTGRSCNMTIEWEEV